MGELEKLRTSLTLPEKIERSKKIINSAWCKHGDAFAVAQSCHNNVLWSLAKEQDDFKKYKILGFVIQTPFEFNESLGYCDWMLKKYPELKYFESHDKPTTVTLNSPRVTASPFTDTDREFCCGMYKKDVLKKALKEMSLKCWASGLRMDESNERADLQEHYDDIDGYEKINPLAIWTEVDEWMYIALNNIDVNPLYAKGYRSIGCEPCTVKSNESERDGRWQGQDKKECGMNRETVLIKDLENIQRRGMIEHTKGSPC